MGLNLRLPQWFAYVIELQTPKPPDQPSRASLIFFMSSVSIHNSVGVVCPCLSLQHFRQPLALGVGVVPEVEEEEQENQAVETDDVDEDGELVWAVLHEEILGDVAGYHNKLDQLNGREVFLPPQVLLVVGAHCRQAIVRVHDNVDDTVEQGVECTQTTWSKSNTKPPGERHDGVMVHMKKCNLTVLLPQDKEDCVQHLNEL